MHDALGSIPRTAGKKPKKERLNIWQPPKYSTSNLKVRKSWNSCDSQRDSALPPGLVGTEGKALSSRGLSIDAQRLTEQPKLTVPG